MKVLSASSKSIGINLTDRETISENSCTGNPSFLKGFKNHPIDTIISLGEVVNVKREAKSIIIISLRINSALELIPSRVIPKELVPEINSPGVKKRLRRPVRRKSHTKGRRVLKIEDIGRWALWRHRSVIPRGIKDIFKLFMRLRLNNRERRNRNFFLESMR